MDMLELRLEKILMLEEDANDSYKMFAYIYNHLYHTEGSNNDRFYLLPSFNVQEQKKLNVYFCMCFSPNHF